MEDKNCQEPNGDADNGNEGKRTAVYGLTPKDLLDKSLVVPAGKHVVVDGLGKRQPGIVQLLPKGIDDVKRWIGVPDRIGARRFCGCQLPPGLPAVSSAGDYRKLDPQMRLALRAVADEYVNGDSNRVAAFKPALEHLVDRATINGAFLRQDIDIHRGAVLEIAKSVKVLFARHIRIWQGGQLKLRGDTRIDCVSITGNIMDMIVVPVDLGLVLGHYATVEAANG